jgi:hypothetical protein
MVGEILRSGFALANRRPGLIVLDLLWKSIWVASTAIAFFVAVSWVASDLLPIEWDDWGIGPANGLIAMALLREFWNAHHVEVFLTLGGVLALSMTVWFILEAAFRRRLVAGGLMTAPKGGFHILLISNAAKSMTLLVAGFVCVAIAVAGAVVIAVVSFAAFAFLLTLVDTLIRADAVDLFGTDLFRVAGLLGILVSFESMVAVSALAIFLAGFANVTGVIPAAAMLGAAVISLLFLNILHSYLLLVRFSAIAIMRQNVVEV